MERVLVSNMFSIISIYLPGPLVIVVSLATIFSCYLDSYKGDSFTSSTNDAPPSVSISSRECPTRQTSSISNLTLLTTPVHVDGILATSLSVYTSTRSSNLQIRFVQTHHTYLLNLGSWFDIPFLDRGLFGTFAQIWEGYLDQPEGSARPVKLWGSHILEMIAGNLAISFCKIEADRDESLCALP